MSEAAAFTVICPECHAATRVDLLETGDEDVVACEACGHARRLADVNFGLISPRDLRQMLREAVAQVSGRAVSEFPDVARSRPRVRARARAN